MMVNCPKCGFVQPKDQFCAKCGVDMLAYRPPEQPLSKKLMTNWVLQVAIVALICLIGFVVFRDRTRANLEQRAADIDSAPQAIAEQRSDASSNLNSPPTTSTATSGAGAAADQPAQRVAPQPQAVAPQNVQPGNQGTTQSAAPPTQQGAAGLIAAADQALGERGAGANSPLVRSVRISFMEAQRGMIAELNRNTVNLASYGNNFTGGVVTDLGARLSDLGRSMRPLDQPFEYPIQLNQPIVVFKGGRDEETGTNIGLTVQITPTANDETGVQIQVEVLRVLKEQGGISDSNFQDSFVIPKEGGAYMAGLFNRRQLTDPERAFYANAGVLKILTSQSFIGQQTDFLLIIHAK